METGFQLIAIPAVTVVLLLVPTAMGMAREVPAPEYVVVDAGTHHYRAAGEFIQNGVTVDAPLVQVEISRPIEIMKYQVSVAEYAMCVADKACSPPLKKRSKATDTPVTGVSFTNAQDYAKWLTGKTGMAWRLPSDEEWSYAAGSRFVDDAIGAKASEGNPSRRWLLKYQKYIDLDTGEDTTIKPRGAYGANENGLHDLSGNVWEWTTGCYARVHVNETEKVTANCGIRIAEGLHRAYIPFFVQDAKGGGCAVGAPPDYLGFRLVKDSAAPTKFNNLKAWWRSLVGS